MGTIRGFLVKHRVNTIFRRVFRRQRHPSEYLLNPPRSCRFTPISRFLNWTLSLSNKAKDIASSKNLSPGPGYIRVGQEKPVTVPKGHLAVYVGQKDGDFQRILVPVVYFNHPSFCELLKESERVYGFHHPGGITIPCRMSEFERVQTRIKAGHCTRKSLSWKKPVSSF